MTDNRSVFATDEFDRWVNREPEQATLAPEEQFLIEQFFEKHGSTLEAGTGGGRIMLALQKAGFTDLTGFDFVPGAIEAARKRDTSRTIQFDVQDATNLTYPDAAFDQAIYPQQILCFIEHDVDRQRAVEEAFRVLKPGSPAIFTALAFDARRQSRFYQLYLTYLRLLRQVKRTDRSIQSLPWLRLGERVNPGALVDSAPYNYWYRTDEFLDLLTGAGFEIIGFGTSRQLQAGQLCNSVTVLHQQPLSGHLFVMARRR